MPNQNRSWWASKTTWLQQTKTVNQARSAQFLSSLPCAPGVAWITLQLQCSLIRVDQMSLCLQFPGSLNTATTTDMCTPAANFDTYSWRIPPFLLIQVRKHEGDNIKLTDVWSSLYNIWWHPLLPLIWSPSPVICPRSLSLNPNSAFIYLPLRSLMGLRRHSPEAFWGCAQDRGTGKNQSPCTCSERWQWALSAVLLPHVPHSLTEPPAYSQTDTGQDEGQEGTRQHVWSSDLHYEYQTQGLRSFMLRKLPGDG